MKFRRLAGCLGGLAIGCGCVAIPRATASPWPVETSHAPQKMPASIQLAGLVQAYDGVAKTLRVTTAPVNLAVSVTYDGSAAPPVYPGEYVVRATINDPLFQGSVTEMLTVSVTALVQHAPTVKGGIDGSMQVLSSENVEFAGDAWMSGDLLVPGTPTLRLRGPALVAGMADDGGAPSPTNGSITLSDRAVVGYLIRRIDPIAVTRVSPPPEPAGTRDVVLNTATDSGGDFATIRDLTVGGTAGEVMVPAGTYGVVTADGDAGFVFGRAGAVAPEIYNLHSLITNNGASIRLAGPVLLLVADGVALGGIVGDEAHPEWLTLAVASGPVTVQSGAIVSGYVVAPQSTVELESSARVAGEVTSDRLIVNSEAILEEPRL